MGKFLPHESSMDNIIPASNPFRSGPLTMNKAKKAIKITVTPT